MRRVWRAAKWALAIAAAAVIGAGNLGWIPTPGSIEEGRRIAGMEQLRTLAQREEARFQEARSLLDAGEIGWKPVFDAALRGWKLGIHARRYAAEAGLGDALPVLEPDTVRYARLAARLARTPQERHLSEVLLKRLSPTPFAEADTGSPVAPAG